MVLELLLAYFIYISCICKETREYFKEGRCVFGHHDAGLGDRLLDSIGYAVVCKRQGKSPTLNWCRDMSAFNSSQGRTMYSPDLFDFPFETTCVSNFMRGIHSGYSLNPYGVADMLGIDVDAELIKDYVDIATRIRPAPSLDMPLDLADVIGVHLRKSDKISDKAIATHITIDELANIITRVKNHILANYDQGQRFFVCSEDSKHRGEFVGFLISNGFVVVESGDTTRSDVVDFFYLSRCREILQGIKYSTFSMTAAIIGQIPLINFANDDFVKNWAPLLVNHTIDDSIKWVSSENKKIMDEIEYPHSVQGDIESLACLF